jgi:hypothetical protein
MVGIKGSGGGGFPTIKNFISNIIHYQSNENITDATLTVNFTTTGTNGLFLSNNDGANYEAVSNGEKHTFTTTGQKLKIKIVAATGVVIGSELQSNGKTYTPAIQCSYNTVTV